MPTSPRNCFLKRSLFLAARSSKIVIANPVGTLGVAIRFSLTAPAKNCHPERPRRIPFVELSAPSKGILRRILRLRMTAMGGKCACAFVGGDAHIAPYTELQCRSSFFFISHKKGCGFVLRYKSFCAIMASRMGKEAMSSSSGCHCERRRCVAIRIPF